MDIIGIKKIIINLPESEKIYLAIIGFFLIFGSLYFNYKKEHSADIVLYSVVLVMIIYGIILLVDRLGKR